MTPERGGGQGSPRGKGSVGGRRMGFLEAQIRRANGESIPVWNNMTTSNDDSPVGGRRGSNSGVIR